MADGFDQVGQWAELQRKGMIRGSFAPHERRTPTLFADAYATAAPFTRPVIISQLALDGTCQASIGCFVVVNSDGWILTSVHIIELFEKLRNAKEGWLKYESALAAANSVEDRVERKVALRKLGHPDRSLIKDYSFWWSWNGVQIRDATGVKEADIAVAQLEPFDKTWIPSYPILKDPTKPIRSGTSLCRMGFPFHDVKPTHDGQGFHLPNLSMVFFPNEGILTRLIQVGSSTTHGYLHGFVETSSPGLKGQSGGPLIDAKGTVYGIQSHTTNLPLGFSPPVPGGKPGQVEHQFLNVGRATHPETVVGLLKEAGVAFQLSPY
jgi:hypothetical protein